jgi:hypothetical protein
LGKEAAHSFKGKVVYAPCRTPVRAPSDWDGVSAKRSQDTPRVQLRLEHVFGLNAALAGPRLLCTRTGELLFAAAALGVVAHPGSRHQRFFRGHDDDVTALCLHPNGQLAATGQAGKKTYACVWDTTGDGECREMSRLAHAQGEAVVALAFTADGARLISVGVLAKFSIHGAFAVSPTRARITGGGPGWAGCVAGDWKGSRRPWVWRSTAPRRPSRNAEFRGRTSHCFAFAAD